jgi:outer membrane protein
MRIKTLLPACLLLFTSVAPAADLLEVYEQALTSNPQLAAAKANLEAVREQRPQAMAGLLPTLGANGSYTPTRYKSKNPDRPVDTSTNKLASLDLTQPLFRYDRWIQLKQADSQIAAAEADYYAASQDLMVEVSNRYFAVLGAQDNLAFAQAEKSSIGRQLDQATQRFDVGLIAITDVKAAQARYDLSVSAEIQAVSGLVAAKDSLRETVGTYYDKLHGLEPDLELSDPNPDSAKAWLDRANVHNLSILSAQASAETAQQEIELQRSGHLPTLDLSASTSYVESGGAFPRKGESSEIGLELNIPLYTGGSVNSRTRQARSRFQEATEKLSQAVRSAELDTRDAFRSVKTDIAQVNALGKSLESTEIAVQAEEAGFEVGTRTIVDVLNSQREYYLARLNYARARYLYVVDQLRLKRAAGILSENDLAELNTALVPPAPAPEAK